MVASYVMVLADRTRGDSDGDIAVAADVGRASYQSRVSGTGVRGCHRKKSDRHDGPAATSLQSADYGQETA